MAHTRIQTRILFIELVGQIAIEHSLCPCPIYLYVSVSFLSLGPVPMHRNFKIKRSRLRKGCRINDYTCLSLTTKASNVKLKGLPRK